MYHAFYYIHQQNLNAYKELSSLIMLIGINYKHFYIGKPEKSIPTKNPSPENYHLGKKNNNSESNMFVSYIIWGLYWEIIIANS